MLSWLFNNTESSIVVPNTTKEIRIIDECNNKWLRTKSWILEKQSNICYTLSNSVLKDVWLIYIKPVYSMRQVTYDIGVKQVYYPHVQTVEKFQQTLEECDIPISFCNKQVLQIGKESMSIYLCIKGTEFRETDNIADALY